MKKDNKMKSINLKYIKENPSQFKICKSGVVNYKKNKKCIYDECDCGNNFNEKESDVLKWVKEQFNFLTDGTFDEKEIEDFGRKKCYDIEK